MYERSCSTYKSHWWSFGRQSSSMSCNGHQNRGSNPSGASPVKLIDLKPHILYHHYHPKAMGNKTLTSFICFIYHAISYMHEPFLPIPHLICLPSLLFPSDIHRQQCSVMGSYFRTGWQVCRAIESYKWWVLLCLAD